jgi:hypothetical protein
MYGSFIKMPGKMASPEKRSYYYGTEGVLSSSYMYYILQSIPTMSTAMKD